MHDPKPLSPRPQPPSAPSGWQSLLGHPKRAGSLWQPRCDAHLLKALSNQARNHTLSCTACRLLSCRLHERYSLRPDLQGVAEQRLAAAGLATAALAAAAPPPPLAAPAAAGVEPRSLHPHQQQQPQQQPQLQPGSSNAELASNSHGHGVVNLSAPSAALAADAAFLAAAMAAATDERQQEVLQHALDGLQRTSGKLLLPQVLLLSSKTTGMWGTHSTAHLTEAAKCVVPARASSCFWQVFGKPLQQ